VTEDEGWPRGTVGHLSRWHSALITGAAIALITLVVVAGCVAGLLVLRALS
jgi:hypothetical protein